MVKKTSPVVAIDLTVVQRNQTDNVPTATFTTDIKKLMLPSKQGPWLENCN